MSGSLKVWTDADNCGGCNHCGMDMDMDPFCVHPTVTKNHPYGLLIGQAKPKYCEGKLWEKRVIPDAIVSNAGRSELNEPVGEGER